MTRLLLTLAFLGLTAAAGAQSSTPPKSGAGRASAPAKQASAPATPADANGFRIGDVVEISTGQGWMKGTILSANGNVYRVRSQIGIDTTKLYPDEVRRIGPLTPKDRRPVSTTCTTRFRSASTARGWTAKSSPCSAWSMRCSSRVGGPCGRTRRRCVLAPLHRNPRHQKLGVRRSQVSRAAPGRSKAGMRPPAGSPR